jgi:hypothetical protein
MGNSVLETARILHRQSRCENGDGRDVWALAEQTDAPKWRWVRVLKWIIDHRHS